MVFLTVTGLQKRYALLLPFLILFTLLVDSLCRISEKAVLVGVIGWFKVGERRGFIFYVCCMQHCSLFYVVHVDLGTF